MASEPQFCPSCGGKNAGDAVFCENCGANLATDSPAAAPVAAAAPSAKKKMSPILMAVIGIVVIAGGALAAMPDLRNQVFSAIGIGGANDTTGTQVAQGSLSDSMGGIVPGRDGQLPMPDPCATAPNGATCTAARRNGDTMAPVTIQLQPDPPPPPVTLREPPPQAPQPPPPPPSSQLVTRQPPPPPPAAPPSSPTVQPTNPPPAAVTVTRDAGGVFTPPSAPETVTPRIARGTMITLKSAEKVCTDKNKQGDRFRAAVQQDIAGVNGGRIPKGAFVTFEVTHLKRGKDKEKTELSVVPLTLEYGGATYQLEANTDSVVLKKKGNSLLGGIVGAAAGIAAAKAAGGSTGAAVAGGVVGGAAGVAIGGQLGNGDGCLEKDAYMRISLHNDLSVRQ